ncbi:hypothetical protein Tco_1459647 [Tanacetum coccineum]
MHQTYEKSSLAMTHKLDDMIELPKSQPKETYNEDLECEMVMVKIPRCMHWLDTYDEPIGDLDMMEDEAENPSPLSTHKSSHHLRCPELKLNKHEQLQIFYQGLDVETKRMLDFKGPIHRMIFSRRIEAIKELAGHPFVWHNEEGVKGELEPRIKEINPIFEQIADLEQNMKFVTKETRMVQHKFDILIKGRVASLE